MRGHRAVAIPTETSRLKETSPMKPYSKKLSRRFALTAIVASAALALAAFVAAPANAAFGIHNFDVTATNEDGTPATQAGSHPYAFTITYENNFGGPENKLEGDIKDMVIEQ